MAKTEKEVKKGKKKISLEKGSKKSKSDDLTPLEKARAARAAGKTKGKAEKTTTSSKAKPKQFTWKAPESLGAGFTVEVSLVTEKDGMPGGRWRAVRIKGRYPTEDDRKMFDLAQTDPVTFAAIVSRLSLVLFHPTGRLNKKGQSPRLQPKTQYRITLRCTRRKADDNIVARIQKVWVVEKNKKGKIVANELDKKELDVRKFKKINKHLPAAFLRLADLPEIKKRRAKDEDDDE